jgi:uncharacterized protein YjbI with pentapeptide repeats
VVKQLINVRFSQSTLKLTEDGSLTTASTSGSGLQREELNAAKLIARFLPRLDTTHKYVTCGQVAKALQSEHEDAIANAHRIAAKGLDVLARPDEREWPRSLAGVVTCHMPSPACPVGNITPYSRLSKEAAEFVHSCLTIEGFFFGTDSVDNFLLSLRHITLTNIEFDSYRPGSINFSHSQIKGGVFHTPRAAVDLTNATLENLRFGNPRKADSARESPALTLTGATCVGVDFAGINPFEFLANRSRLLNVNLSDAILEPADFSDSRLENVCFDHTQAKGINLSDAELKNVIWRYADFSNALLNNTRITLDLSEEALEKDPGFRGALSTINTLPDHYKTLKDELTRSVKQRLNELAVDHGQPTTRKFINIFGI